MDRKGFDVSISYYPRDDKPYKKAKHGIVRIAFSVEAVNKVSDFITYSIDGDRLYFVSDSWGRTVSLRSSGTGEILYQTPDDIEKLKPWIGCYNLYFDWVTNKFYLDLNEKLFVGDNKTSVRKERKDMSFKDDIGEALSNSIIEDNIPERLSTINEDLLIEIHGQLSNPIYALEDYCGSNEVSPILDVISVALINVLKHIEEEITKNERV